MTDSRPVALVTGASSGIGAAAAAALVEAGFNVVGTSRNTAGVTATDAKPKLRYPAGRQARQLRTLRRIVPARAFDKQIHKFNRLPA